MTLEAVNVLVHARHYFIFQGSHFQQIFGCPMGSPVSAILANLVMEHVEEKALSSALPNGGSDT